MKSGKASVGHFRDKHDAHKTYLFVGVIAPQFAHSHAQIVGLTLGEIVVDVVDVFVVHDVSDEIFDVDFRAAIHDCFQLIQQFVERHAQTFSNVIQG